MKKNSKKIMIFVGIPLTLIVIIALFAVILIPTTALTGMLSRDNVASVFQTTPVAHDWPELSSEEVFAIEGTTNIVPSGTVITCNDYPRLGPRPGNSQSISMDGNVGAKISAYSLCHSSLGGSTESYYTGDIRFYFADYNNLFHTAKNRFIMTGSCDDVEYFPLTTTVVAGTDAICYEILETKQVTVDIPLDVKDFNNIDPDGRGYNSLSVSDICGYDEDEAFFIPYSVSGGSPVGVQPYYYDASFSGKCARVEKIVYTVG